MTQSKRTGSSPDRLQGQFRTPRRPITPATSLNSTSTKSRTKASPAVLTPATALKKKNIPPTRSQSTLTQIDFVTQPTNSDQDQLDYIAEGPPNATNKKQTPAQLDDGSEDETDYRPPLRTRPNLTKFETSDDHPKRRRKSSVMGNGAVDRSQNSRRSYTPKASGSTKGKRKSIEKPGVKRDKTLTQMDFVRRYITIDDSDDSDVNMGYIQPAAQVPTTEKKLIGKEEQTEIGDRKPELPTPTNSSKRARRQLEQELDLNTGEPLTSGGGTQNTILQGEQQDVLARDPPSTPQKYRKLEIPSSQSPESPGVTFITSSQFRHATHSPTKPKPLDLRPIKEEPSDAQQMVKDSQGHEGTSQLNATPRVPSNLSEFMVSDQERPPPGDSVQSQAPGAESASEEMRDENQEAKLPRSQRERNVVYETDAESSASEFEDTEDGRTTLTRAQDSQGSVSGLVDEDADLPSDDSQDLPLPNTQPPGEMDFDLASEPPMSDMSAYYQRVQPATQFPHEPVPDLNTQKLSELFPNEGSTQYPRQKPTRSSQKFLGPFQQSQSQSQSQHQSQEPDQTEIVPESSPLREQQSSVDEADGVFHRPHAPGSVVQVESSQPVRRTDSGPGNVLSRSQLLSSSVMESIALPNFWVGSQESVGEPYSLPSER